MNRTQGRTDLLGQMAVGCAQWLLKARKSLASLVDLQIACKENVQLHTQVLPSLNSKYHCYSHRPSR